MALAAGPFAQSVGLVTCSSSRDLLRQLYPDSGCSIGEFSELLPMTASVHLHRAKAGHGQGQQWAEAV